VPLTEYVLAVVPKFDWSAWPHHTRSVADPGAWKKTSSRRSPSKSPVANL
jgi:hypothetical protein